MEIIDVSDNAYSFRHGRYGGQAGDKDGIIIDGENWIVKYPKSTRSMEGTNLSSYTTSPLSEYIGSHIYEILGYNVHKTKLVYRNNQIAVACKDFQIHFGDLAEIRTLKNAANKEIQYYSDEELPLSATGDNVNLNELFFHFQNNPLLNNPDLIKRFWECVIVDIFIDNNDRNNGNWGLLFNENTGKYDIAPIYDNGNSFNNKLSEFGITQKLNNLNESQIIGNRTAYSLNGHTLSAVKMLNLENKDLQRAILEVIPKINKNINIIKNVIDDIPVKYKNILVCSNERKEYYKQCLDIRLTKLLIPTYQKCQNKMQCSEKSLEDEFNHNNLLEDDIEK